MTAPLNARYRSWPLEIKPSTSKKMAKRALYLSPAARYCP